MGHWALHILGFLLSLRSAPSVSYGSTNLFMRGALEAQTRPNLSKVRRRRRPGLCGAGGNGALTAQERHRCSLQPTRALALLVRVDGRVPSSALHFEQRLVQLQWP
jgi:hypothetical protein